MWQITHCCSIYSLGSNLEFERVHARFSHSETLDVHNKKHNNKTPNQNTEFTELVFTIYLYQARKLTIIHYLKLNIIKLYTIPYCLEDTFHSTLSGKGRILASNCTHFVSLSHTPPR